MGGCKNCNGCSSCGGCASLELTKAELELLEALSQFAFLPVARKESDMTPVYLEDGRYTPAQYSIILQLLETKRLISIDYDKPLACYGSQYAPYRVRGSFALTQRGQMVLEQLDIWGVE